MTPASLSDTSLGTSFASSVATNPHNGRLAESAIWNAALTAAEMASLGAGFSPLCIRPSALVAYWPQLQLLDPVHDRFGSTLDETGTVVLTAHPRIIYPTGPQVAAFS